MRAAAAAEPRGAWGARPRRLTPGNIGIYAFLIMTALFFAIPLYVMIVTSLKTMAPTAPAVCAFWTFSPNVHVPR